MNDLYLAHHGILGQKWGIRRYQNEDGSLTDEGYRHYGYGKHGKLPGMAENTKQRIKQGSKVGSAAGALVGASALALRIGRIASVSAATGGALSLAPLPVLVTVGSAVVGSYTASGYLHGALYGGIVGAIETKKGQKYIESQKANDIKISDLKEKE